MFTVDPGLIGIAGIVGTLLGTALGATTAIRVRKMQQEHEDRTRFHQQRFQTYAAFRVSAMELMRRLRDGSNYADQITTLNESIVQLTLIASAPVLVLADKVWTTAAIATRVTATPSQAALRELSDAIGNLLNVMRDDLGVKA